MAIEIVHGLRETPEDSRDFSVSGVFGSPDLSELPESYCLTPLRIQDQQSTDICSACAITAVREQTEGVALSPEYQFARTRKIMGEFESWGADLRSACKAAVKGSLVQEHSPFKVGRDDRNQFADWNNWSTLLDVEALEHRARTYWKVSATYDDIRLALWRHREDKAAIVTGCKWRMAWLTADGVIPTDYDDNGFGHAIAVIGWKPGYLILQLSNGTSIGDQGLFYMPQEIVEKELGKYGCFMFKDMTHSEAKWYNYAGITVYDSWSTTLTKLVGTILSNVILYVTRSFSTRSGSRIFNP